MLLSLKDKVCLITGGGRGIGREAALAFAREGSKLVLASRTQSQIDAVARECQALGAEAIAVATDVGDGKQVQRLFERAAERFGHVDLLLNNAGSYEVGEVKDFTEEQWDAAERVNLKAYYLCSRAALLTGKMLERKSGTIINIASISMRREVPGLAAHCAFKHAVLGFCESLRREVAPYNIRVSIVAPGTVDTQMVQTPQARQYVHRKEKWLKTEDVVDAVLFVAKLRPEVTISELSIVGT